MSTVVEAILAAPVVILWLGPAAIAAVASLGFGFAAVRRVVQRWQPKRRPVLEPVRVAQLRRL